MFIAKKILTLTVSLGCLLLAALFLLQTTASADSFSTERWKAIEITLTSAKSYSNPYVDVDVSATFVGPGGVTMVMPGFWDGGSTWRIRFAPTVIGAWTYTTSSTDTTNTGLHNKTGTITTTAYTGNLDIYKHGFLKRSANNRYLTYNDGTPFFWLGDMHWMGLSYQESLDNSADPRWSSMFKGMVDVRAQQGYTAYEMNLFATEMGDLAVTGTYNEGGHPWAAGFTGYYALASSSRSQLSTAATNGYNNFPKKAIDGNVNTYWEADPSAGPHWFIIDLGQPTAISKVETYFGSSDSSWKYTVQASYDKGINYMLIVDKSTGVSGQFFSDNVSITARYIRINILGSASSAPAIREFKVIDSSNWLLSNFGILNVLNPAFWHNVDERVKYVTDKGMVAPLGLEWGSGIDPNNYGGFQRLARYVLARYGAYPAMWVAASEYVQGDASQWGLIAKYFKDNDPYARATSLHNGGLNENRFRDQYWYDIDFLQSAHGDAEMKGYSSWLQHYNETPTRPVLEAESQIENLTRITPAMTRHAVWMSFVGGAFGYTYGAEGIWNATYDQYDTWQAWGGYSVPWFQAIDAEAGKQMVYYKDLLTGLNWSQLEPNASAITWTGAPSGVYAPFQKAVADKSAIVAFLPVSSSSYTGVVNGLSGSDTYTAKWLNVRSGSYTTISTSFTPGGGTWSIPSKPDNNDWVLVVQKTTNTTAEPTASIDSGAYAATQSVTLASGTSGASIYYTLDGSTPTAGSTLYSGAISIAATKTLRAVAVKSGLADSAVIAKYYRIGAATPVSSVGTRLIDNIYNSAVQVQLSTATSGASIYYTLDNTMPTSSSNLYSAPITLNRSATLRAIAIKSGIADSGLLVESYQILESNALISRTAFELEKRISASSAASGFAAGQAVDNDLSTSWKASGAGFPQWFKADLGRGYALTAVTQRFATSATWKYKIEGSNDDSTYTMLVDRTASGVAGTSIAETVSGSYRYIKLTITGSSGTDPASSSEFMVYGKSNVQGNISLGRDYTRYHASSAYDASQQPEKAFDSNANGWTDWQAANGLFAGQWLEVDYGWYTPVNRARLIEYGGRTSGFRIESWNSASWDTVYTGTTIPGGYITFPTVNAVKLRVYFNSGSLQPIIYEFESYYDANEALNKAYSSSSDYAAGQTADKAFDENGGTNWQAGSGLFANQWLQADLGANVDFNEVLLSEYGGRTTGYRIEYWNGTIWQTAYTGTTLGYTKVISFPTVRGSKARIYFTAGSLQPIIYEFKIYKRP